MDDEQGDAIAVYYCQGGITRMASSSLIGQGQEIVSDKVVKDLEELGNDNSIKAVVIRINSGGGDAYASEQIWRASRCSTRRNQWSSPWEAWLHRELTI